MNSEVMTPEEVAADVYWGSLPLVKGARGSEVRDLMAKAIKADREARGAQAIDFTNPLPLIESRGGVFVNERGDKLVELLDGEDGVLVLVRANGSTATLSGSWSTGCEA